MDHDRIETRKCSIITNLQFTQDNNKWKNLRSIVMIECNREYKNSDKRTETAVRYYTSSLKPERIDFQKAIRSHWGIENKLHWILGRRMSPEIPLQKSAWQKKLQKFSWDTFFQLSIWFWNCFNQKNGLLLKVPRKRKENRPQNFSILNKIALNLLKISSKVGVKSKYKYRTVLLIKL